MNYQSAIQFLYDLQMFGTVPGLENTLRLAALAGNPQDKLRFIHVAGTNGKGSTCAMLEAIYRAAGLRVGLFTSPHLVTFGERIQVNRQLISDVDVVRLVAEMRGLLQQFPVEEHPTFFEVVTVMALRYFAEQGCDLVIWETGLGGRLDSTNIVTPLASVVTNIQFDHQEWLGDTLERIAFEKAGIIKPGVPVITAVDDLGAFRILFEVTRKNGSPFWLVTRELAVNGPLHGWSIPLFGEHQQINAAVAAYTVQALQKRIPVDTAIIRSALSGVRWAGRFQVVQRAPDREMVLDGAHNIGSAEVLRTTLAAHFGSRSLTLVLGILRDKDWEPMCRMLAVLAARILLVPVNSRRSAGTGELAAVCRVANPSALIAECDSLRDALDLATEDPLVVVTGSLYLVGEAMELCGLSPAKAADERKLNEWSGTPMELPA